MSSAMDKAVEAMRQELTLLTDSIGSTFERLDERYPERIEWRNQGTGVELCLTVDLGVALRAALPHLLIATVAEMKENGMCDLRPGSIEFEAAERHYKFVLLDLQHAAGRL